jgi:alpha-ketoglutarate-dependent taurine dioxygenase
MYHISCGQHTTSRIHPVDNMSRIDITSLHDKFAAAVNGIQVTDSMTAEQFAIIRQALDDYGVLVFPNQQLNAAQQQAFAERFGALESFPEQSMQKQSPKVYNISNVNQNGELLENKSVQARMLKGTELWHTDSSYRAIPALASFLYALEIPPSIESGGQTEFADMISAYAELPQTLLAKISNRHMVHNYEFERLYVDTDLPDIPLTEKLAVPPVTHPIVRYHPQNDKKSIYITSNVGNMIGGYDYDDARAIHTELLDFVTQPAYVYQHQWTQHDLVVWDNRRLLHRVRPYDMSRYRRVMQRTTVADTEPPVGNW